MTDIDNAKAEREGLHEFVVSRLSEIKDAGDDPAGFASALMAYAVRLNIILHGEGETAAGLVLQARHIMDLSGVAGHA